MKKYFQEFIFYNRGQRLAILILSLLLLAVGGTDLCISHYQAQRSIAEDSLPPARNESEALHRFLAGITTQKPSYQTFQPRHTPSAKRFPFNPNTADSAQLHQLGLPNWMIRNILNYRAKGGRFRQAEDFKKIYGLKEELFASLLPYIKIPADTTPALIKKKQDESQLLTAVRDSPQYVVIEKYSPGTVIELNRADTTELKKIPGIGSGIARRIVAYRKQLGGYYDLNQLKEINLQTNLLSGWFQIDTTQIIRIPVNQASVARLQRHPYINFYQAKAIVDYRKKKGSLHSLKPLTLLEEFTQKDFERIRHYVDFSEPQP